MLLGKGWEARDLELGKLRRINQFGLTCRPYERRRVVKQRSWDYCPEATEQKIDLEEHGREQVAMEERDET